MAAEPPAARRAIVDAFIEALKQSTVGDQARPDAITPLLAAALATSDGKKPVLLLELHDSLSRAFSADVAGAALLELKAIADKHGVLVELPAHLKTMRLQERQELSARFRPRPATVAPDKAPPAQLPSDVIEQPVPAATPRPPARRIGVSVFAAAGVALAYVVVRSALLLSSPPDPAVGWKPVTLPANSAGLPCVSTRAAGSVLECTMTAASFRSLSANDFRARAIVTRDAARAAGSQHLRIQTEDGAVRGVL